MKAYRHISQVLTLSGARAKDGRRLNPSDIGLIDGAAIVFEKNEIIWIGKDSQLPTQFHSIPSHNLQGHVVTPALVDSHTHLLFGGNRASEYVSRLNGVDYQAIANAGGGILFTVRETLKLSEDELYLVGADRLNRLISYGVGTIEIKSGYALTLEGELRILRAAKRLKKTYEDQVRVFITFLGAHAIAPGFSSSTDFINQVVIPTLEVAAHQGLVDAVDVFHETGYFSTEDATKVFERAKALGIARKSHADEFHDNDGASLAASHGALSADHLLKISSRGIQALASSSTVATLLPGTAFFLGKPLAPARALLDSGAKVAIASDYNPGSCHWDSVLAIAATAAPMLKMNQTEMWAAITLNASHALDMHDQGALEIGLRPSFAIFQAQTAAEVTYSWGKNLSVSAP